MKKSVMAVIAGLLWVMIVGILPAGAYTIDIDLNNFYLEGNGIIAGDGSSAFLEIDSDLGYALLQNDPFATSLDPGIVVPAGALSLSFGFDFSEAAGNDTEFYVRLFDGNTGVFIDDFLQDGTILDTHQFDLAGLSTNLLGLDFQLIEYETDPNSGYLVGSTVTIRDLQLAGNDQLPIPEPGTLLLLGIGLFAFSGMLRKRGR